MNLLLRTVLTLPLVLAMGVVSTWADLGTTVKVCADEVIAKTMAGFWGHARGYDGQLLQPADDEERRTLPIPRADAERIVNEAIIFGVAHWCHLDWQPVYLEYMQIESKKGWKEKQRAFVGVLFGATQGTIAKSMPQPCSDDERKTATLRLGEERERLRSLRRVK